MQIISIAPKTARKVFWSGLAGLGALLLLTAEQGNPLLLATCFLVILTGVFPSYIWLLGRSHGLPIWPAFSAYSGLLAVLPVIQASKSLATYSDDAIFGGLVLMTGFLLLGSLVWMAMTAKLPRPPKTVLTLEPGSAVQALFWCLFAGVIFQANLVAGWINFPGNTMQIARGIAGGLSYLGVFALAYFQAKGLLGNGQTWLYYVLLAALVVLSLTGLMLAAIVPLLALALIGFTLGAGRLPWIGATVLFVVIAILHAGKYPMREIYYNPEGEQTKSSGGIVGLPGLYAEWFSYGFQEIGGILDVFGSPAKQEEAPSSVFERAGNLHMLLLVLDKTPREIPYLNGITYEPIPRMLIPRFLDPEKGISHVGNVLLSVNYGLLDEEGARRTSIGWSLVAEAYANFGLAGVFVLSVLLAVLYSEITRLSSGVPITSLRFISGLIILAGVTNENSLGVFITMQFQGIVGVALASFVLMRRHPNPFYFESGSEGSRKTADGMERGTGERHLAEGIRHTAYSGGKQLSADGGVVRTMPIRMPKRIASWMPRKVRAAVAAEHAAQEDGIRQEAEGVEGSASALAAVSGSGATGRAKEAKRSKDGSGRPRQLAVPYQHYRRYRG